MKEIRIIVTGMPGKMATLIAEAISSQEDMSIYMYGFSEIFGVIDSGPLIGLRLVPEDNHLGILMDNRDKIDLIVDFTQPKSVNRNAELYCEVGIPFVMGTTGGDRKALAETVEKSDISAVIATNMAVPVVMFQSMIHYAAKNFPHSLEGFKLVIRESHQAPKVDVSGTAVSLLESFAKLGMPLKKEQIIMVRDPVVQEVELGIPQEHLGGHGYHTYTLLSPDGTVKLQFTHNILGRSVYVDGALKAIRFLAKHKQDKGKVFSMVDVLQNY